MKIPSLYLVTDSSQDIDQTCYVVRCAAQMGCKYIQVRKKDIPSAEFLKISLAVKKTLRPFNTPLIINDSVEVALAVNADGLHLGQDDLSVLRARSLLRPHQIIGVTVESWQQFSLAQSLPVRYISVSSIFKTTAKRDIKYYWGLEQLKKAAHYSQKELVAIGGINRSNIQNVAHTQVDTIAVTSAVCRAPDPTLALKDLISSISYACKTYRVGPYTSKVHHL